MREDHLFVIPGVEPVRICPVCDVAAERKQPGTFVDLSVLVTRQLNRPVVVNIWSSRFDQSTTRITHIGQDNALNERLGNVDRYPTTGLSHDFAQLRPLIVDWPGVRVDDEVLPTETVFRAATTSMVRDLLATRTDLDEYLQYLTVTDMPHFRELLATHKAKWWPWLDLTDYKGIILDMHTTFDKSEDSIWDSTGDDAVWYDWVVNNMFMLANEKLPEFTETFVVPTLPYCRIQLPDKNLFRPIRVRNLDTGLNLVEEPYPVDPFVGLVADYAVDLTTGVVFFNPALAGTNVQITYFLHIWGTRAFANKLQDYKDRFDGWGFFDLDFFLDRYEYNCRVRKVQFEDRERIYTTFDSGRRLDNYGEVDSYWDNWGQEYRYHSNFIAYMWLVSAPDQIAAGVNGLTGNIPLSDETFWYFDTPEFVVDQSDALAVGTGADEVQRFDSYKIGNLRPVTFDTDPINDCDLPVDVTRFLRRQIFFPDSDPLPGIWHVEESRITYVPISHMSTNGRVIHADSSRPILPVGAYAYVEITIGTFTGSTRTFTWTVFQTTFADPHVDFTTYSGSFETDGTDIELINNIVATFVGDLDTDFTTGDKFSWIIGWNPLTQSATTEEAIEQIFSAAEGAKVVYKGSELAGSIKFARQGSWVLSTIDSSKIQTIGQLVRDDVETLHVAYIQES